MKNHMTVKQELVKIILSSLEQELTTLAQSAQAAHEAATHEESKAEDSHDTRGLEASYLAGAQMARIENLKKVISAYRFSNFRDFSSTDPIDTGALIELELDSKRVNYFLTHHAGGKTIVFRGKSIQILTPQSPLGEALMGRRVGEIVEVETHRIEREYEITGIS